MILCKLLLNRIHVLIQNTYFPSNNLIFRNIFEFSLGLRPLPIIFNPKSKALWFWGRFQISPMRILYNGKKDVRCNKSNCSNLFMRTLTSPPFSIVMWVWSSFMITTIIIIEKHPPYVCLSTSIDMWWSLCGKSCPRNEWAFSKLIVWIHTFHLIKLSFVDNKISWPKRYASQWKMCVR